MTDPANASSASATAAPAPADPDPKPAPPEPRPTQMVVAHPAEASAETGRKDAKPAAAPLSIDWASLAGRLRLPRPRLRLVPAIIFVAVLMLGVRVGDLWDRVLLVLEQQPLDPPHIAFSPDQESGPGRGDTGSLIPTAVAGDTVAPAEEVSDETADDGVAEPPAALAEAHGMADPPPVADGPQGLTDVDPRDMSAAELEMLRGLSRRRSELDARASELDQREALLEVAERRMAETMTELEALRAEIEAMLGQADERREQQLVSLVRMYEAMRPADAAAIFDGLELEVLLNVLERMREAKAAPIVAGMSPERAREVTSELALRQSPVIPESE